MFELARLVPDASAEDAFRYPFADVVLAVLEAPVQPHDFFLVDALLHPFAVSPFREWYHQLVPHPFVGIFQSEVDTNLKPVLEIDMCSSGGDPFHW